MCCTGISCSSDRVVKSGRAFYYWKSVFDISPAERELMHSMQVQTLYVRYFDVDWDPGRQQPVPLAPVRPARSNPAKNLSLPVVPTVFITNETMLRIPESVIPKLATDMLRLIASTHEVLGVKPSTQVQIDCDWNASSKDRYFSLLKELQAQDTQHLYSATIRLHQLKYATTTGVPPVSRGMLMCYNMGNLKNPDTQNSILDPQEVQLYTQGLQAYALPLDVALPLFGWTVRFRNQQFAGLLPFTDQKAIRTIATPAGDNRFRVMNDTLLFGYALQKGDILRVEESQLEEILHAAGLLQNTVSKDSFSVTLYHLDSTLLNKFTTHELETVFNSLH